MNKKKIMAVILAAVLILNNGKYIGAIASDEVNLDILNIEFATEQKLTEDSMPGDIIQEENQSDTDTTVEEPVLSDEITDEEVKTVENETDTKEITENTNEPVVEEQPVESETSDIQEMVEAEMTNEGSENDGLGDTSETEQNDIISEDNEQSSNDTGNADAISTPSPNSPETEDDVEETLSENGDTDEIVNTDETVNTDELIGEDIAEEDLPENADELTEEDLIEEQDIDAEIETEDGYVTYVPTKLILSADGRCEFIIALDGDLSTINKVIVETSPEITMVHASKNDIQYKGNIILDKVEWAAEEIATIQDNKLICKGNIDVELKKAGKYFGVFSIDVKVE